MSKYSSGAPPSAPKSFSIRPKTLRLVLFYAFLALNFYFLYLIFFGGSRTPDATPGRVSGPVKGIQIEVVNATGRRKFSEEIIDRLRTGNIDVVASPEYQGGTLYKTIVIDRTGDRIKAGYIAGLLGIDTAAVLTEVNEGLLLDVSVLLGKDFDKLRTKD